TLFRSDLPLGFDESLEDPCLEVFGMLLEHRSDRLEHLVERLVEFGFARVAGNGGAEDVVDVSLNVHVSKELSAVERRGADVAERAGPLRRRRSRRNAAPEVVGSMASCRRFAAERPTRRVTKSTVTASYRREAPLA